MLKKILIAVAIIALGTLWFFDSMSAFEKIYIEKTITGGESFIYKEVSGNYKQSGKVMKEIYDVLLSKGISSNIGIGVYYDNPKQVKEEKLRSEVGIIIEESFRQKIEEVTHNYKIKQTNKGEYLQAEFPYKSMISIFIGMYKFYPELKKEIDKNGYKQGVCSEIYDMKNQKIYYRMEM